MSRGPGYRSLREVDPGTSDFLKERLFGLSNPQGNHGESVKEAHFHIDNTPTVGGPSIPERGIGFDYVRCSIPT